MFVGVLVGGTGVLVGVWVGVFVAAGVFVGVLVGVCVGVFVVVGGTGVFVGVCVGVFVAVGGTSVFVGVLVGVAVSASTTPFEKLTLSKYPVGVSVAALTMSCTRAERSVLKTTTLVLLSGCQLSLFVELLPVTTDTAPVVHAPSENRITARCAVVVPGFPAASLLEPASW